MSTVTVCVRKAGRVIDTVERPLRYAEGGPAVVYRKKFWRLTNGRINLDSVPLDPDAVGEGADGHDYPDPHAVLRTPPDDATEREAIRIAGAPARMLVEAGPGTGKTQMAALRLTSLIRSELSPGQVLVLSFSRSAVRTLTRRLTRVAEANPQVVEELRHISIRTFDSWAFRMLRLLGRQPAELLAREHDDNIAELTDRISGPQRDEVRALVGDRRHLIVDEFQDLPGVRGELVLALLSLLAPPGVPGCGFTILGDPAQAIYGFAARAKDGSTFASPSEYWKRVRDLYGSELEIRALRRNFRAEAPLAGLASDLRAVLLSHHPNEEKRRLVREAVSALPPPPEPPGPTWLAGGQSGSRAVLTRTNGEALRVLKALVGKTEEGPATPVRLRAGSYATLPPAWIGALLRKLRTTSLIRSRFATIYAHLTDIWDEDTRLSLGLPPEDTAWTRLALASGAPEDATAIEVPELRKRLGWPDAFPDDQPVSEEGVIITTIHQSKGMEFDIVTVLDSLRVGGDEADDADGPAAALEEATVAFVAVTRAGRALNRITADNLYRAPTNWSFPDGRQRLCHWWNGWINMEMGLRGDLDSFGFVDPALHGGADGVEDLQNFLLQNARQLEGHQVMLCKHTAGGKAVWHVHLQNDGKRGRLIGRTASQLTFDLLHVLHSKGYALPKAIMNLRIAAVGTVSAEGELPLEEPDRTSRLWLGVSLFGTGDFQTWKKERG